MINCTALPPVSLGYGDRIYYENISLISVPGQSGIEAVLKIIEDVLQPLKNISFLVHSPFNYPFVVAFNQNVMAPTVS